MNSSFDILFNYYCILRIQHSVLDKAQFLQHKRVRQTKITFTYYHDTHSTPLYLNLQENKMKNTRLKVSICDRITPTQNKPPPHSLAPERE